MKTVYDDKINNLEQDLEKLYEIRNEEIKRRKKACKHEHCIFTKGSWVDYGYGLNRTYPLMILSCEDCDTEFGSIEQHNHKLINVDPAPLRAVLQSVLDEKITIPEEMQQKTGIRVYEHRNITFSLG